MDINILLALQDFRNGAGACLVDFMTKMSFIGEMNTVLIIMALIYRCVSKDFGQYLLMGWSGSRVVNGLLKVTACVYRPWIKALGYKSEQLFKTVLKKEPGKPALLTIISDNTN